MWFYKGIKLNFLVTKQKTAVAQKLQNKSYINNHNYCRIHRKFVKLTIQHNRKYQAQNCENFSPIERQNWHFLRCHGYCYTNSVNCSYAKASKAAIDCSPIYCEGK